jgi:monothiol glutaredoxin
MVMTTIVRRAARAAVRGSQRAFAVRALQMAPVVAMQQSRSFSAKSDDGSHSDFQPKYHAAKSTEKDEILKMIESHVKTYPVMLYMKGTPSAPQCGFSMQVVRILHAQGVSFDSVNVLDHPEIRDGVKEYSYGQTPWIGRGVRRVNELLTIVVAFWWCRQWPTIPQLYVKGKFVGGCDIITDMSKSGELAELLAEFKKTN